MNLRFRTQVEIHKAAEPLTLSQSFVSLGSCFSQAIGNRLKDGGADIEVCPTGILFNPVSIAQLLNKAIAGERFDASDLYRDSSGIFHALAFESRRRNADADALLESINADFDFFRKKIIAADCWLVTFGTAWCFRHLPTDSVVGNCHKLPDAEFERFLCSVEEIVATWDAILKKAPRVVFTVSPVRHLNDGLHGNTLSKARLHLAVEELCRRNQNASYFPAYEALTDDLRDYRFYANDLKHPSEMAEEYIFNIFTECFFPQSDVLKIEENRRSALKRLHRPILSEQAPKQ